MNQAAEAFLQDVWPRITEIYDKENQRIGELPKGRTLQAGIMNYLKVAWRKPKLSEGYGTIHIDVYEPFDWSDDSYRSDAGAYVAELTDEVLTEELFPALFERLKRIFLDGPYVPIFFDYRLEFVLEFERDGSPLKLSDNMRNEKKLLDLKNQLDTFIHKKIMPDLPVLPAREDEFFFARLLLNPDVFEQSQLAVEPLIRRLSNKLVSKRERLTAWEAEYGRAFKDWAEERFLPSYFRRTGHYGLEWTLKEAEDHEAPRQEELDFFVYAAKEIGAANPDIRKEYLDLAVLLGSEQAAGFLERGSGHIESIRKGERFEGNANDILQTIEIRLRSEEEAAYGEALDYIISLLQQGLSKEYKLSFKSREKHYLPLNKLAKSQLHQFFGNALRYPSLYPRLAEYAELALEEFAWYGDVEPGEKSAMPGTYADLKALVDKQLQVFAGTAAEYPMGYAMYLHAAMQPFQGGREIVISGKREDLLMQEMIAAVQQSYLPGTAVLIHWDGEGGAKLRGLLPHVREMKPVSGKAAAYICEHFSCKEPVTTLEALREALVNAT